MAIKTGRGERRQLDGEALTTMTSMVNSIATRRAEKAGGGGQQLVAAALAATPGDRN